MGFRMLKHSEITPKHESEIFSLAREWWERISDIPLNEYNLIKIMKDKPGNCWVDDNNEIAGYYILLKFPHPFNSMYTIAELVSIVVDEKYRGSNLFFRMWKRIKEDCDDVKEIHFTDTKENPMPYMEKLGFTKQGIAYRRDY